MTIDEFIAVEMAKPFRWRETDCCATADRRIRQVCDVSPFERGGIVYSDEDEAAAVLSKRGGLPIAVNRVMRHCGFRKVDHVAVDDIGLVLFGAGTSNPRVAVAIWTGSIWWSRDMTGFLGAADDRRIKAWRVR